MKLADIKVKDFMIQYSALDIEVEQEDINIQTYGSQYDARLPGRRRMLITFDEDGFDRLLKNTAQFNELNLLLIEYPDLKNEIEKHLTMYRLANS